MPHPSILSGLPSTQHIKGTLQSQGTMREQKRQWGTSSHFPLRRCWLAKASVPYRAIRTKTEFPTEPQGQRGL